MKKLFIVISVLISVVVFSPQCSCVEYPTQCLCAKPLDNQRVALSVLLDYDGKIVKMWTILDENGKQIKNIEDNIDGISFDFAGVYNDKKAYYISSPGTKLFLVDSDCNFLAYADAPETTKSVDNTPDYNPFFEAFNDFNTPDRVLSTEFEQYITKSVLLNTEKNIVRQILDNQKNYSQIDFINYPDVGTVPYKYNGKYGFIKTNLENQVLIVKPEFDSLIFPDKNSILYKTLGISYSDIDEIRGVKNGKLYKFDKFGGVSPASDKISYELIYEKISQTDNKTKAEFIITDSMQTYRKKGVVRTMPGRFYKNGSLGFRINTSQQKDFAIKMSTLPNSLERWSDTFILDEENIAFINGESIGIADKNGKI